MASLITDDNTTYAQQMVDNFPSCTFHSESVSCPTCGYLDTHSPEKFSNKVCVPTTGPVKPILVSLDERTSLTFPDEMTDAERAATGSNLVRCQGSDDTCDLCGSPCQQSAGSMWYQLTGWDHVHIKCWKNACLVYHTEFLEAPLRLRPNTLGNFIRFLENWSRANLKCV